MSLATRCRRSKARDAGYTLMELLVVLAILGFLAAIGTPIVLRYLETARVSTAIKPATGDNTGRQLYILMPLRQ